jgi:hypothetical protein
MVRRILSIAVLSALAVSYASAQQSTSPGSQDDTKTDSGGKIVQAPRILAPISPMHPSNPDHPKNYRCAVQVDIDASGVPQGTRVVRCSDPEYGRMFQKAISESRFTPALTQSGERVATSESVLTVKTNRDDAPPPQIRVRYALSSPSGTQTGEPDASGVYPLTKLVTKPLLVRFSDQGYGDAAYSRVGSSPCDFLLTIDGQGKVVNPSILKCADPSLEKPAVESLKNSKFKPGALNGKLVPIRLQLHLEFDDFSY